MEYAIRDSNRYSLQVLLSKVHSEYSNISHETFLNVLSVVQQYKVFNNDSFHNERDTSY